MQMGGWVAPNLGHTRLESLLEELGRECFELAGTLANEADSGKSHPVIAVFKRSRQRSGRALIRSRTPGRS